MSATTSTTKGSSVTFTAEEREQLLNILEQTLLDKEVEAHRTDTLKYKERVEHQEQIVRSLVEKLRHA